MHAYILCKLLGIFLNHVRAGKNTSNEQNVHSYYKLNHRIMDLLFIIISFSCLLAGVRTFVWSDLSIVAIA